MKTRKRSNAPIFWGLFGAGGMLSALLGPMLVFITGIAVPLGFVALIRLLGGWRFRVRLIAIRLIGLPGAVGLVEGGARLHEKEAPGLGKADASGIALEQKDAEVLLQRLDPRADVGLAGAERLSGAVEAEMFGDGKRLDQRCKWNAPQTKLMAWRI